MVTFKKREYDAIKDYRNKYLDSIYEAQELYIEWIVQKSDYYIIEIDETVGYVIISPEKIIVEFYLLPGNIKNCEWIFEKIINEFGVEKVYCKSFDALLLKCSLTNSLSHQVFGTLFRNFRDSDADAMEEFLIKRATEADLPYLLLQKDELYESEEELQTLIANKNIYMYHLEDQLVGCGFLIKILNDRNFYDIGMWVKTSCRNKGFGRRIIANLKGYCLTNNLIPVCGCAADNLASRKTLEKNGFFSKYDLIEFTLTEKPLE
jgi:predicted acetyltransferase